MSNDWKSVKHTKDFCKSCLGINGIHFDHCNGPNMAQLINPDENPLLLGPTGESDPLGIPQNTPGAKLDAGKVEMSLVFEGFANALLEVGKVATFGANKYTRNGWESVPDGIYRYKNAAGRHLVYRKKEGPLDKDSGLLHEAHELWNHLASFELKLREQNGI